MLAKLKHQRKVNEFSVEEVIACSGVENGCNGATVETARKHLTNGYHTKILNSLN